MLDEGGFDYGLFTGIGLAIAAAVALLLIFSMLKSSEPANTAIALEAASSEVCGDIGTVASMAIPYRAERHYSLNGISITISSDHVAAASGNALFSRPLVSPIVPGVYEENGSIAWNGPAGIREYLNDSFNAPGTIERPIDHRRSEELCSLMERASRSTLLRPVEVRNPLVIEKIFIYTYDYAAGATEAKPYVLVYRG